VTRCGVIATSRGNLQPQIFSAVSTSTASLRFSISSVIQVSIAAPYPGTRLHQEALEQGWLDEAHAELIDERGVQIAPLHYPHLSHSEIFHSVDEFYRRFYFRAPKIAALVCEMARSTDMLKRRLREGIEFFAFLRERRQHAQ